MRTQAAKLAQFRRLRRGRLSRTAPAAAEREALTKLGSDTTRGARVQRLRALQVIGGGSRALVEQVQGESGLRDEAGAIAELFVLPGARPWEHSSAAPEMRQADRLMALGTAVSTWRKLKAPRLKARGYIVSRMHRDSLTFCVETIGVRQWMVTAAAVHA